MSTKGLRRGLLCAAPVFFILFLSGVSYANLASVYGIGNKAIAMGNAFTAHPDDPSATYYNPAGLALEKGNTISIGMSYFYPTLWVQGIDGRRQYIDNDKVLGATLGIAANLGHLTDYKQLSDLSIGILLYTPPDRAYSVHAIPTDTLSFPLYKDTPSQLMLLIGIGYRISDYLMVGVSSLLYMPGSMKTFYYVDTNQTPIQTVGLVDRGLIIFATPEIGIIGKPSHTVDIGFSYRASNASGLKGPTSFFLNGQEITSETNYEKIVTTPSQLSAGVSLKPSDRLRINVDLTYSLWSDKDVTDTEGNPMSATDTLTPAIGVQYRLTDDWVLRGGYQYAPSPFPAQTGLTNYIDSDRHVVSLGGGYGFGWFSPNIRSQLDMFVQLQQLTSRNNAKQLPYESYSSGGSVWSMGVSLTFKL